MKYVGEKDAVVDSTDPVCIDQRIFEFSTIRKDFFLGYKGVWDILTGDVYRFELGGSVYAVPSGHHVVIGDEYGDIDFILIDEVFNRPIELIQLDYAMMNWVVHYPKLIGYEKDVELYWPMTKNIIPIQDNGRLILVTDRDLYTKFKNLQVEVFTSV
jgi:hypothetical protein